MIDNYRMQVTSKLNNDHQILGKTKTIWKELNTSWKEEFSIKLESLEQLKKYSLGFVVKDDARFSVGPKSTMGKVFININSAQGGWHFAQLARGSVAVYLEYPLQI